MAQATWLKPVDKLNDRDIRRGLRLNIAGTTLGMAWMAVAMGMPLTMLMENLGASGLLLGAMMTAQQIAMLAQIPGAMVVERLPSRKGFWLTMALSHRAVWLLVPAMLLLWSEHANVLVILLVVLSCVSGVLAQTSASSWWSWMADLVPQRIAGAFWGQRQSIAMIAFLLSMALAGWWLDRSPTDAAGHYSGFVMVFLVAGILGVLDILLQGMMPEPRPGQRSSEDRLFSRLLAPMKDHDFFWLTLSFCAWTLGISLLGPFAMVYLKREFGVSYMELSLLNITASIGTIVAGVVWGYVMDRIGVRTFGAIMMICGPLCSLLWFFLAPGVVALDIPLLGTVEVHRSILLISGINLVAGAVFSGVGLTQINLANRLAPREGRTMAMAVHWTIIGSVAAIGPLIGGWIMDWVVANPFTWQLPMGVAFSYIHILICLHALLSLAVALPMLINIRRLPTLPITEAISRLMLGNPLRMAVSIYNIYAASPGGDRATRAKAVRKLGESRTALAVGDLIERLKDPSTDVREEAVYALGEIGSPEAVDALVSSLDESHVDLAPQIARALRSNPESSAAVPRTVDVLVERLGDADRETQSESARTLGAIGDRRAVNSLKELVGRTGDAKVLSASSQALAHLGEVAAIYDILPRMKTTGNPVLKRSLSVAVGDLLGEPDGFYKVLTREEKERGVAVDGLLKALRQAIRKHAPPDMEQAAATLADLVSELSDAYMDEDVQRCADLLFDLAIGLAALLHGAKYGGHAKAFVFDLVWRDQRFGVGVWFLDLLRQNWAEHGFGERDMDDVLLGIYFVACQRDSLKNRGGS